MQNVWTADRREALRVLGCGTSPAGELHLLAVGCFCHNNDLTLQGFSVTGEHMIYCFQGGPAAHAEGSGPIAGLRRGYSSLITKVLSPV